MLKEREILVASAKEKNTELVLVYYVLEVWKNERFYEKCALTKSNSKAFEWKNAKAVWTEGNESKLKEEFHRFS